MDVDNISKHQDNFKKNMAGIPWKAFPHTLLVNVNSRENYK